MAHNKAIIVGISGCSSSGKTTLARLLRDIFPNTFILHEDDFYKAEDQLPVKDGLVDWDCPEAISIPDMEKALTHIRSTGTFPVSLLALDSPTLSHRHDHGTQQRPILWAGDSVGPATGSSSSCPGPTVIPRSLSLIGGRRGAAAGIGGGGIQVAPPETVPSPPSKAQPPDSIGGISMNNFLSSPPPPNSTTSSPSPNLPVPPPPSLQESPTPETKQSEKEKEPSLTKPSQPSSTVPQKQPEVDSKEDQNSVGECPVTASQINSAKQKVQEWLQPGHPGSRIFPLNPQTEDNPHNHNHHNHHEQQQHPERRRKGPRICLLDGFLLYSPTHLPEEIMTTLLDIKLFLLVSREKATRRREARDGYVTLEGFWTDPPGYVDKIVWPNYVDSHRWLFEDGDVEAGKIDEGARSKYGILVQGGKKGKGLDVPFSETLEWAVGTIMKELERIVLGEGGDGDVEESDKKE